MKALLRGGWLGSALLLLAGCQSGQQLLLPETTAYSSPCLSVPDTAVAALPTADSTVLASVGVAPLGARSQSGRATARVAAQFLAISKTLRAKQLVKSMMPPQEVMQVRRARQQPFRFRRPQDETEGNPWLLALGVILIAAGIVGGLLIGGGIGIFAGIAVGLAGYYFFMRGLLGPHAWLEAIQELFQL